MTHRYLSERTWVYRLPNGQSGYLDIQVPHGSRRHDEGYARYLLREKLKVTRLEKGTSVRPISETAIS